MIELIKPGDKIIYIGIKDWELPRVVKDVLPEGVTCTKGVPNSTGIATWDQIKLVK